MCGIAGFQGPFGPDVLWDMVERMHHRGPDETGRLLLDGPDPGQSVGLGHKRLSIIDLASGQQPMGNEDASVHVVFNGEIYNHLDIRPALVQAGHRFATRSDTEVIVHGYEQWGPGVVDRLEGMFAFGIWDAKARAWFLARDRFGIKPLYYCEPTPGTIAFASEIKPLLPLVGGARLNLEALYHFLLYGWISTEETIFSGVYQLRPAHWMRWSRGQKEIRRYWRMPPATRDASLDECADQVRQELAEAVRSHLIADVPVGITLSGGLDSSAVLATMAQTVGDDISRLKAFTVGYGLANDEIHYARLAARHYGVEAHERLVPVEKVGEVFERVVWHLEEPMAHPVVGTTWFLAEFVREHLKVVLIGEGSDELFAGYPHYKLFRPPYSWAPNWLVRRVLPAAAFVMPDAATVARLLHPDLLDRPLLESVSHAYDSYLRSGSLAQGWLDCELENELVYSQLTRIDKLTMAHSVEARVPFLDRRFAELAFGVPFRHKLHKGVEKYVLRHALRGRLPQEVLFRPKSGPKGTQNLLPALMERVFRARLDELTDPATLRRRGWLRPEAVREYIDGASSWLVRKHPIDGLRRTKFTFAVATLEQWARTFMDGRQAALVSPRAA